MLWRSTWQTDIPVHKAKDRFPKDSPIHDHSPRTIGQHPTNHSESMKSASLRQLGYHGVYDELGFYQSGIRLHAHGMYITRKLSTKPPSHVQLSTELEDPLPGCLGNDDPIVLYKLLPRAASCCRCRRTSVERQADYLSPPASPHVPQEPRPIPVILPSPTHHHPRVHCSCADTLYQPTDLPFAGTLRPS